MSQNDFTIANQGFPAFRADLNSALQALASNNSGATEPSTMFANMWWYDSANNIMYIRNEDNDAWIKFAELDQANDKFVLSGTLQLDDGTVSAPALTFNSDTNMGIYRGGTDILKFVTAGQDRLTILANGDTGIGTDSPLGTLSIEGNSTNSELILSRVGEVSNLYSRIGWTASNGLDIGADNGSVLSGTSLTMSIDGVERMRIDSSGNVGIGTTSPGQKLQVDGFIKSYDSSTTGIGFQLVNSLNSWNIQTTTGVEALLFVDNTRAEAMRIDSSGNVGIGTGSPASKLDVLGDNVIGTFAGTDTASAYISFKYNTSTLSAFIGNGSSVLSGANNSDFIIRSQGDLVFASNGNNRRVTIDTSGNLLVGKTVADSTSAGAYIAPQGSIILVRTGDSCIVANRLSNDGDLIVFRQDSVTEGNISVSGTTVSYNGGHLSRWSQLTDNTRDNTLVKGTVMTNLDQMAEWTTDGVTEDNEQLNCMAVSSVEGDANVAGVFVNWDNDDDIYTNDMNIAMTGDMVIRIAQGTTVARGDLLMSAGDGTAKPQGDDIVRSKTIAKVTSTNVSHTYDDGTYLVPCVLMAC